MGRLTMARLRSGLQLQTSRHLMGMPKEHCIAMSKPYKEHKQALQEIFARDTLQLPRLDDMQWRIDYILASSEAEQINAPVAQLRFEVDGKSHSCQVTGDKLRLMLHELRGVREMMESI